MHRSVSETRRSVATRPKRSPRAGGRAGGGHQASLGGRGWPRSARLRSRPDSLAGCGPCASCSAGAGSRSSWSSWCSAYATWWLGRWQFHRLEDRQHDNAVVERNESATGLRRSTTCSPRGERSTPTTSGAWSPRPAATSPDETVIVRYRTRDGSSGVDVVVPLQTDGGPALLVDRGWLATENSGAVPDDVPAPPSGEVTVTGYVRVDATGDSARVDRRLHAVDLQRADRAGDRSRGVRRFRRPRQRGSGPRDATGEGRAPRPRQRPALLLRAPVVVLRPAGRLRLLLPGLRRVARRAARQRAVRTCAASRRRRAASRR